MDKNVTVSFSIRSLFSIALALLVLALLFTVRDIVILFVIAYILASAMKPFVNKLHRYKVPKTVSILLLYLILGLILYLIFKILVPPMASQINSLVEDRQELAARFNDYFHQLPDGVESAVVKYVEVLPEKIQSFFLSGSTMENIFGFFAGFAGILTVLFVSLYMLLENSSFEGFIASVWPGETRDRERVKKAFHQVDLKVSMWVRGQLILSLSIGLLTFIGLSILGVPYALVLAIIAAFTELIPIAGPIIGAVPAIVIAFLEAPILALWVVVLTIGVQQFEQHVLVPQVMKRAVGLSGVIIIFSLLVGTKLFGILGAVVAVPVAASIKVLSDSLRKRG
jgi:predicted PurR-regulated permease PerM